MTSSAYAISYFVSPYEVYSDLGKYLKYQQKMHNIHAQIQKCKIETYFI